MSSIGSWMTGDAPSWLSGYPVRDFDLASSSQPIATAGASVTSSDETDDGPICYIFLYGRWNAIQRKHLTIIAQNLEGEEIPEYMQYWLVSSCCSCSYDSKLNRAIIIIISKLYCWCLSAVFRGDNVLHLSPPPWNWRKLLGKSMWSLHTFLLLQLPPVQSTPESFWGKSSSPGNGESSSFKSMWSLHGMFCQSCRQSRRLWDSRLPGIA